MRGREMSDTLNDLFDQIIYSEQQAQKRNLYLQEVKAKISACQKDLEDNEDEREALRGQLVLKVQHLNDEELQNKWLQSRRMILAEKRDHLQNEIAEMKKELEEVKKSSINETRQFCDDVKQFSQQYDLLSTGRLTREKEVCDRILQCKEKEQQLVKDLACYEESRQCVHQMKTEKDEVDEELQTLKNQLCDLDATLMSEQNELQKLEQEREETLHFPQNGAEFQRLQRELDELQSSHLESRCQKLQQDVRSLQHQIRLQQRQIQQQQQQEIHQQQQREIQQQLQTQNQSMKFSVTTQPSHVPQSEQAFGLKGNRHCVSNFPVRRNSAIPNLQKMFTESSSPNILSHVFDDDMSLPDLDDTNMSDDSSANPSTLAVSSSSYQASNAPKPIFNFKHVKKC
ncbi:coiled-coil domain-containing protein 172-like [Gigantopelta aegis]|uniref:coiled-coil domain-containing protein 172-like n=1 Tax=Gigantopelta aegis TaxID=1735272 RepID=UPI001B889FF2|nr:coiled-coil domain-containing protein 172-like [Gigantopelta aegis]